MHCVTVLKRISTTNNMKKVQHCSATLYIYTVSKKTTLMLHFITSFCINRFSYFLAGMLLTEYTITWLFLIPPLPTNVAALPGETWTPEMVFSVPCFENDGVSACYIVDIHQPILIILCRYFCKGHIIIYSVKYYFSLSLFCVRPVRKQDKWY